MVVLLHHSLPVHGSLPEPDRSLEMVDSSKPVISSPLLCLDVDDVEVVSDLNIPDPSLVLIAFEIMFSLLKSHQKMIPAEVFSIESSVVDHDFNVSSSVDKLED